MVLVAEPVEAAIDVGAAATLLCAAETVAAAVTVTVAVCVTPTPLTVALMVFACATVELIVPVITPLALVVPTGCVMVLPVPVEASTTVAPAMGLLKMSRAVTVIVLVTAPLEAVMVPGAAPTVDCAAPTPSEVTVTVAVCVIATPLMVADTVLASAKVELSVPVATPLAFVEPAGCVSVLLLPVTASTTAAPAIALPN